MTGCASSPSPGGSFDEYRLDLERVVDLGRNRALALLVQRGRIKAPDGATPA